MTKKIAAIVTDLVEDVELSSPKEALEKMATKSQSSALKPIKKSQEKKEPNSKATKELMK